MNRKQISEAEACNSPVAWFVIMERAIEDGDFDLAAKAKRELDRLGIIVKYRKPKRKGASNE